MSREARPSRLALRLLVAALPDLALLRAVAPAAGAALPFFAYSGALLCRTKVEDQLRELVILRVAVVEASEYEVRHHRAIATRVGTSPRHIAAIAAGQLDAQALPQPARAAVLLADEIARNGRGRPATVAQVRAELGERQLQELLMIVAHYIGVARMVNTLALEPDREPAPWPPRIASLSPWRGGHWQRVDSAAEAAK